MIFIGQSDQVNVFQLHGIIVLLEICSPVNLFREQSQNYANIDIWATFR
jgi:hypothetical protein